MKRNIFLIHGFLGRPDDWDEVVRFAKLERPEWNFIKVNMSEIIKKTKNLNFSSWVEEFKNFVQSFGEVQRTIVGYSLGGRLSLACIESNAKMWDAALFISTNPGVVTESEKIQRLNSDKNWANRFLTEEFSSVLKDWNAQPVFLGSVEPMRRESDYNKKELEQILTQLSLAQQKDYRSIVGHWETRQIWVSGEKDIKFTEILKTIPYTENIQRWTVEGASHRVLFEAPQEIAHFIIRISSKIPIL